MSDLLQPGQHPDADQLNAFIEHALPLHERQQTLAHLAVCSDCRQVVSLSQQSDISETLGSQTVPPSRPWFSAWKVAWPVAATLTCIVVFTIHVRNTRLSDDRNAITTIAEIKRTPPPLEDVSPVVPSDQSRPAPPRAPNQPTVGPSARVSGAATKKNSENINGPSQLQKATVSPLQGRNTTFLPQAGTVSGTGSLHGSAYRSNFEPRDAVTAPAPVAIGGLLSSGTAAQPESANSGAINRLQQNPVNAPPESSQVAPSANRTATPQYQAAAAPPLMAADGARVSQTVEVMGEASDVNAAVGPSQPVKERTALPSHLQALSIASNGRQTLAIDTGGTLFLSKDGTSWQPIETPWAGRAVKVRLILSPSPSQQATAKDAAGTPATQGRALGIGNSITPAHSSVFELTTEAGVIWTSADGRDWKYK